MKKVMTFREKLEAKKKEGNPEFIQTFNEKKQALDLHLQLQQQLKSWKEQAGITSAEIADKMGLTPSTVSRLEQGADKASIERILKYANACGLKEININVSM
ncbi:helix-turn-helix domain-containing protein [Xenorhabdus thuongxuanensis]|uniref:Repressor of flagellae, MrxJ n=1 Tax=Xenorhabdus thuongxuanensis TaxID=1873484 RepID=A0A1Q5TK00_9GAMM|nr:helix-turn-helix transcriptional regulator [Xenorhabdus thuongxuanensis]OKP00553.1 Repressor of flagellae, MrxJ [Xenorhabdus thuongxuanensis]